jgi:hypothetical protein
MIYYIGLIAVAVIGFRILRWIFYVVACGRGVTNNDALGIISGLIVALGLGVLGLVLLFDL